MPRTSRGAYHAFAAKEKPDREIRALRIHEGATEVQKIVIARELLKMADARAGSGLRHKEPRS